MKGETKTYNAPESLSAKEFTAIDRKRIRHNRRQEVIFDSIADEFLKPLPEDILERLSRIAAAAEIRHGQSVLDVGTGTGVLLPYILHSSPARVVACDLSEEMLKRAQAHYMNRVLFVHADVVDLPAELGPFDRIICNGVFGNFFDQNQALAAGRRLLKPRGRLIISHPMGRTWLKNLKENNPRMVLHDHPDEQRLEAMCEGTGFRLETFVDESDIYVAVLVSSKPIR